MIINSIYDVTLKIGGYELLNTGIASDVSILINEDIADGFPICQISFESSREFLNSAPIIDGTLIEIHIESQPLSLNETLYFRVSEVKAMASGFSFRYMLNGFLDFYELFRNANKYAAFGTSSEVFKNFAEKNKLVYRIDNTNDAQIWIPSEINVGNWLTLISNHGWTDMSSCMVWFMNRRKELYYINVDRLFYDNKKVRTFLFGDLTPGDIENQNWRYKAIAFQMDTGTENIFNKGYDGRNFHFDLLKYSQLSDNANKVRAITQIVNINKELSQGLEETNMEIDTGNFHNHYFMASTQNSRIRSSLSTYAELSCEYFMPIYIGQVFKLEAVANGTASTYMPALNCQYLVSSILTKISSAAISMDVTLCTQGYNGTSTESY